MFAFVLEVVAVSIVVSIVARWLKLIPRYSKLRYAVLMQALNTVLLTVVLSVLLAAGIYPSWALLAALLFVILWLSVRCTNYIARRGGEPRS